MIVCPGDRLTVSTFGAEAALRTVLLYLRQSRQLADKTARILVPQGLGTPAYQAIHKVCFPINQTQAGIFGVLMHHQFGFPQNMTVIAARCRDENLFLIESSIDCAESYWERSALAGQPWKVASIFSYPQQFPVAVGGALFTTDEALLRFAEDLKRKAGHLPVWANVIADKLGVASGRRMAGAIADHAMHFPDSPARLLVRVRMEAWVTARRKNYALLREMLADTELLSSLEPGLAPSAVPIVTDKARIERVENGLRGLGYRVRENVTFDIHRNVFDPRYERVALVPLETEFTAGDIEKIAGVIRKA